jgi:hypothetical protein
VDSELEGTDRRHQSDERNSDSRKELQLKLVDVSEVVHRTEKR